MKKRIERVDALIKNEVSKLLLKEVDFPDNILVTVTRVETTPNLIESKVYVSVLPEKEGERIFTILDKIIYGLQQKINNKLRMRPVPKIIFVKEEKTKEAARVEAILEELKNEGKYSI